ncbi:MAG: beta-lactamase family protein [Chloroflexota bacterium]|nr:beta-lactamase family protein [Chloroflexota bacterium]
MTSNRTSTVVDEAIVAGELGGRLDTYLGRLAPFGFTGAVLVARAGEVVLNKGYGMADREGRLPNTVTTLFDTASVTKWFTAAAILKLEQEGRLRVSDSLGAFFSDVPPDKSRIILHHLLTHTAGLPLYSGPDEEPVTRDEMVRRMLEVELESEPGTQYSYSNPSYSLLAAIVEVVTGRSYEAYLREQLFLPAGMHRTGYALPRWLNEDVAHYYDGGRDAGVPQDYGWGPAGPGWNLYGNGGMLSTTSDFYRWHLAVVEGELLSEEARFKMLAPQAPSPGTPPPDSFTGYGVYISETERGTRVVSRGGTGNYVFADYQYFIDEGVVLVVLTNTHRFVGRVVEENLVKLIFHSGEKVVVPPETAQPLPRTVLDRYRGLYAFDSGAKLSITRQYDALVVEPVGQGAIDLFAHADPAMSLRYKELNARTARILDGVARGDFTALAEESEPERFEARKRRLEHLWAAWAEAGRPYAGHTVLGTTPSIMFSSVEAQATAVLIRLADGSADYQTYLWKGDELMGLAEILTDRLVTSFMPQAGGSSEFVGFNPLVQKPIGLRFDRQDGDGKPTSLSLVLDGQEHRARRVAGDSEGTK